MKKLLFLLLSLGLGTNLMAVTKEAKTEKTHRVEKAHKKHFSGRKLTHAEKVERAEKRLAYKKEIQKLMKDNKNAEFVEKANEAVARAQKHLDFLKK